MCLLPIACGWQEIHLECEPKCIAILAQGLRPAGPPADSDFQKAMSQPMDVDLGLPVSTSSEHKGKGGKFLKATSEFFENKYKAAAVNEAEIHLCLATDSSLPKESEGRFPQVWPTKDELTGMEFDPQDLEAPKGHRNYPSAEEFSRNIKETRS